MKQGEFCLNWALAHQNWAKGELGRIGWQNLDDDDDDGYVDDDDDGGGDDSDDGDGDDGDDGGDGDGDGDADVDDNDNAADRIHV